MRIPIKVSHLKAVSLFSADKDIRYYLNGVMVDVLPDAVRLCATDGHMLALTHTVTDWGVDPVAPCQIIIPTATVKLALKSCGKCDYVFLEPPEGVYLTPGTLPHILHSDDAALKFFPVDGTFPHYHKVIPQECSGEIGQFNPEQIYRFQRAANVYNKNTHSITIEHNGNKAALIHGVDAEFCGVVMSLRADTSVKGPPEWLKETVAEEST